MHLLNKILEIYYSTSLPTIKKHSIYTRIEIYMVHMDKERI